ncbi:hypothetical protein L6654_33860 [Bradyrhizobium sp. WYCCWR 13023]|uniref:Uncharacterized protein n=1 Tax=Bradyrhizobium zhengyangense TaxID=2911009 RepID=A0A9X1RFG9_9BRAD|nr:hypothetical protein [Bradyrhizobium zhengyangense]MCG2631626.1 hypothetical protein [Bradyrhizobium zhengyangense]
MADLETAVESAAIERVMATFVQMKNLRHQYQVQAGKDVAYFSYAQVTGGEVDEKRLVVAGLRRLKDLERTSGLTR